MYWCSVGEGGLRLPAYRCFRGAGLDDCASATGTSPLSSRRISWGGKGDCVGSAGMLSRWGKCYRIQASWDLKRELFGSSMRYSPWLRLVLSKATS